MTERTNRIFYAAILSATVLMALLLAGSLLPKYPFIELVFTAIVIMFEIVVPIEILKRYKIPARDFNIYGHNIDTVLDIFLQPQGYKRVRPDFKAAGKELLVFLRLTLIVFIPYIFAYWTYFKLRGLGEGKELLVSINWPPELFYQIVIQLFVVALPEELFYRGFLQSAFLRKWPMHKMVFGFPLGKAIILTNIIFALGHIMGSWAWIRLLTFFPGLLFSYLIYKNRSLFSAVLFHASCNILGQLLYASIRLSP